MRAGAAKSLLRRIRTVALQEPRSKVAGRRSGVRELSCKRLLGGARTSSEQLPDRPLRLMAHASYARVQAAGDVCDVRSPREVVMPRTFTLAEQSALGSQYSWRLKDSEIRFRGAGDFEGLVTRRIPASDAQVDEFFAALELLHVWEWRSDYDPSDVGVAVQDGSSWSFIASDGDRECHSGGVNAYPSLVDHEVTTVNRGRFALLLAALYDCFGIEGYIQQARLAAANSGEPGAAAEGGGT